MRTYYRVHWGARAPKGSYTSVDKATAAVLHHSAGPVPKSVEHAMTLVRAYQYQHMFTDQLAPGGAVDIGYHLLIDYEGNKYRGRPLGTRGAHAGSSEGNALPGICLLGNYDTQRPSQSQERALVDFCRGNGIREISPHSVFYATACPGIYGIELAEKVNRWLSSPDARPNKVAVAWPPPHGNTLTLYIHGIPIKGWSAVNNRLVSIATYPQNFTTEDTAIEWRDGKWTGNKAVVNVAKALVAKFQLRYR